jgi:uncharacterized glyoxalase superfamily protein PhnB
MRGTRCSQACAETRHTEGQTIVQLHTYLNYGGNCEDAFTFYEHHLSGKITMLMRHGEQPGGQVAAPDWAGKVLHTAPSLHLPAVRLIVRW